MTAPYQQPRTGGVGGVLRGVLPASKSDLDGLEQRLLAAISKNSQTQSENQKKIMKNIDDVIAEVSADTAVQTSAVLLLQSLHDSLEASKNDPAKIEQIITSLSTNRDALAAAVVANTPAAA